MGKAAGLTKNTDDLNAAAQRLSRDFKVAATKEDIALSFGAAAAACKFCHADFRKKK